MVASRKLKVGWAGLPRGADVWVCDRCGREFKSRADAEKCEQFPLPKLPLPEGTLIVHVNRPTGTVHRGRVIGVQAMNGHWRGEDWVPHHNEYVCESNAAYYHALIHPDDILETEEPT